MLQKQLDQVSNQDISRLIEAAVPEGKILDYKRELPGNKDEDKKEFLADVSSFANTVGGDLIIGVQEEKGVPIRIEGCVLTDPDAEITRLENILRDGIEPRISVGLKVVKLENGNSVLAIRTPRSWIGPHRVIYGGRNKFYARNAGGKYEMGMSELRSAFNSGETISQRAAAFRTDRITKIQAGKTPVPAFRAGDVGGGGLVLHLVPLESLSTEQNVDFLQYARDSQRLRPIGTDNWSAQINLDGVVSHSGGRGTVSHAYTQLYRNGIIEALKAPLFYNRGGQSLIFPKEYELRMVEFIPRYLEVLKEVGINPPIVLYLSLLGTMNTAIATGDLNLLDEGHSINENVIMLPEIVIQRYEDFNPGILRPALDMVWNAAGHERSFTYDAISKT
jgi:hypothetical protein